jgi:L-ascorbate metabolism protein UlaG (beta-lactamase superfamily)
LDITYLGGGSIKVSGKRLDIICDPAVGSKVKADVVTWSAEPSVEGVRFEAPQGIMVIEGPGEYEVKGANITGVPTRLHTDSDEEGQRGTAYSLVVDGINVAVVGNVTGKLAEDEVETLGQVDVLVVPVGGGGFTLDAQGAAEVVAQLEPNWVVPVHYDDGSTKYPVPQAKVDEFLKEMGANPEPMTKLKVSQKEPPAETQVVLLSRAGS